MSKVAPDDPNAFPCTIKYTSVSGYTPEYLAAKGRVNHDSCTVSNGVKVTYFTDGEPSGVPVICLHGGSQGKYMWLQKEPLPGVYMIAIDRPGYGDSDDPAGKIPDYPFEMIAKDIGMLADHLKIDKFILLGFSIGTSWAQQIACVLTERVRGLILFGCMADSNHPKMTAKMSKKVGKPPKVMDPNGGCLGFVLRGAFSGPIKQFGKYDLSPKMDPDAKRKECEPRLRSGPPTRSGCVSPSTTPARSPSPSVRSATRTDRSSSRGSTTWPTSSAQSTTSRASSIMTWARQRRTRPSSCSRWSRTP